MLLINVCVKWWEFKYSIHINTLIVATYFISIKHFNESRSTNLIEYMSTVRILLKSFSSLFNNSKAIATSKPHV